MNFLAAISDVANNTPITTGALVLLCLAVGLALAFEFVNGFHDTANAVATVIYTHSLKPWVAVVWSGCWNLTGVLVSGGGVAFGVLALLPVEMLLNTGSSVGFAMVFALLLSAIIWNLGTWYLGLPASSSHSLFGAIIGVGIANALMKGHSYADGLNWTKLEETLLWLLLSPLIGFFFAGLLLIVSKMVLRWPQLYQAPDKDKAPPLSIRALLVLTCTGVSFGHGSNDGQKGMGLILLILIGILPGTYALNPNAHPNDVRALHDSANSLQAALLTQPHALDVPANPASVLSTYLQSTGVYNDKVIPALTVVNGEIASMLNTHATISGLTTDQRSNLRRNLFESIAVLSKMNSEKRITDANMLKVIGTDKAGYRVQCEKLTQYIPLWVKVATALSLGLGTMIGWKRIVVTVGEKIGKTHLTYAQGAAAELVAAATIVFADQFHKPVSTTHVLSSGVAGTMAANRSGLQADTLRSLLLAWVLTLPVCVMLGAGLFAAGLVVVLRGLEPEAIGLFTVIVLSVLAWKLKFSKKRQAPSARAPEFSTHMVA